MRVGPSEPDELRGSSPLLREHRGKLPCATHRDSLHEQNKQRFSDNWSQMKKRN